MGSSEKADKVRCKCCGREVLTKEEVYEFVKQRGSVTNDEMYQMGYGEWKGDGTWSASYGSSRTKAS